MSLAVKKAELHKGTEGVLYFLLAPWWEQVSRGFSIEGEALLSCVKDSLSTVKWF